MSKKQKRILVDMACSVLHHGHIRILKKAYKFGKVIVALTSDKQILKYKKFKPKLNFKNRKEILLSIKYVSEVIKSNHIITNEFLQVSNLENVWAIGDSALIPNKLGLNDYPYSPPTAQFAVRQAKLLAKNIILKNMKKNLREFKYKSKGSLASLGSKKGVGKIYFFNVKGLLAWIIWRVFYLSFLILQSDLLFLFAYVQILNILLFNY